MKDIPYNILFTVAASHSQCNRAKKIYSPLYFLLMTPNGWLPELSFRQNVLSYRLDSLRIWPSISCSFYILFFLSNSFSSPHYPIDTTQKFSKRSNWECPFSDMRPAVIR